MLNYYIIILILTSIFLGSIGQVFYKYASKKVSNGEIKNLFSLQGFIYLVLNKYFIFGSILYFLASFIWIYVLSKTELSLAYPMISLSYVIVLIISYFIFGESITFIKIFGIILIILGVNILLYKG